MLLAKLTGSRIDCLHHLFEEQVRETPDAIAVTYGKQKLNYYELNQLSNQLACYLAKYAVTPNTQVAICTEPALDTLVGLLGILKAGGACVPLSPDYSRDRLTELLNHTDAAIVLTQSRLKNRFTSNHHRIIALDSDAEWLGDRSLDNNSVSLTEPVNLACVNYRFKSRECLNATGLSHKTAITRIQQQLKHSDYPFRSKALLFSPLCTITAIQELFATWLSGGNLILVLEELRRDAFALWRYIRKEKINRLHIPLIALQQLIEINDRSSNMAPPETLTTIITAGEPLQVAPLTNRLIQRFPSCKIVNQYTSVLEPASAEL